MAGRWTGREITTLRGFYQETDHFRNGDETYDWSDLATRMRGSGARGNLPPRNYTAAAIRWQILQYPHVYRVASEPAPEPARRPDDKPRAEPVDPLYDPYNYPNNRYPGRGPG